MEDFIDQLIFNFTVQAEQSLCMIWAGIVILFAWKMKRWWTFLIASFVTLFSLLILSVFLDGYWDVLYMHETYKIHDSFTNLSETFYFLLIFSIILSGCSLLYYSVFYSYRKKVLHLRESQAGTLDPRRKYALILVFLLFIFLFLSTSLHVGLIRMNRMSCTYKILHELFRCTQSFEEKLAEQTKNSDQSLWENFSNLIQKEGFFTKEEFDRKFGKDLWGNRYNIDYTTNLTSLPENLSDYLNQCPIVIWSNGRNRTNERCLGDDIFWPTHITNFHPVAGIHRKLWESKTNLVYQPTAENETINQN